MWIECKNKAYVNFDNVHNIDYERLDNYGPYDPFDNSQYSDVWISVDDIDLVTVTNELSAKLLIGDLIKINAESPCSEICSQHDIEEMLKRYNYT